MTELAERLRRLREFLGREQFDSAAVERFQADRQAVLRACGEVDQLQGVQRSDAVRELWALTEAAAAVSSRLPPRARPLAGPQGIRLSLALWAADACTHLAVGLALAPADAERLGADLARVALRTAPSLLPAIRATAEPGAAGLDRNLVLTASMLSVVPSTVVFLLPGLPEERAAAALPPDLFVPWAAAIADAVLSAAPRFPQGKLPLWALSANLFGLLAKLSSPAWAQHSAALAAAPPAVHQALATLLVGHAVPALAAAAEDLARGERGSSEGLTLATVARDRQGDALQETVLMLSPSLADCLALPCLAPGLGQRLRRPGGEAALLSALRLLAALPTRLPAGGDPVAVEGAITGAAHLVGVLLAGLQGDRVVDCRPGQAASAAATSSGDRSGGGSGVPPTARLQPAVEGVIEGAVPAIARVLHAAAAGAAPGPSAADEFSCSVLFSLCHVLLYATESAAGLLCNTASVGAHFESALAAADAAARLVPLCTRLAQSQAGLPGALHPTADGLRVQACDLWRQVSYLAFAWNANATSPEHRAAADAACKVHGALLWRLHSSGCRAVHALLAVDGAAGCDLALLEALSFGLALALAGCDGDADSLHRKALMAAHLEACRAMGAVLAGGAAPTGDFSSHGPGGLNTMVATTAEAADGLMLAAADWPWLVDSGIAALLRLVWGRLPKPRNAADVAAFYTRRVAGHAMKLASTNSALLSALASHSLLGDIVSMAQAFAIHDEVAAVGLYQWLGLSLSALRSEAEKAALAALADCTLDATERPLHLGVHRAAQRLLQALEALGAADLANLSTEPSSLAELPPQLVAGWRRLLPPAAELGASLLEEWALPCHAAERYLQLARAGAQRSCAYLRCANVAVEGGPAAGEGSGSAKCSGCRVAWYCDTTCSHADWRGPQGHRRTCKALAAWRQQQRDLEAQAQHAGPGAEA